MRFARSGLGRSRGATAKREKQATKIGIGHRRTWKTSQTNREEQAELDSVSYNILLKSAIALRILIK